MTMSVEQSEGIMFTECRSELPLIYCSDTARKERDGKCYQSDPGLTLQLGRTV